MKQHTLFVHTSFVHTVHASIGFVGLAALVLAGCVGPDPLSDPLGEEPIGQAEQEFRQRRDPEFTAFSFSSYVSRSGEGPAGDVRLDSVTRGETTWSQNDLQTVDGARILVDDGVDVARGGHNLASGRGIDSELDGWEDEGPATITPDGDDLAGSLGNFNLTSIVVTRENLGTASVEVRFEEPADTFFFWERGNANSPTTANSDLLVEALDGRGRVIASHKLLRSEYAPTGIAITTWNGSFASPSTPGGTPPQLGSAGLSLSAKVTRLRLTSVQEAAGGTIDDGPDYKVIAAAPAPSRRHSH
jgi:hypothetical protein